MLGFFFVFQEILGVWMAPFLLMTVLPRNAERLMRFVHENTVMLECIGPVCVFSTLDLRKYGTSCLRACA